MSETQIWLIWSNEHGAWWGSSPDNFNYVRVIRCAWRYTHAQASQIVADANRFQREGEKPNEVMLLAPEGILSFCREVGKKTEAAMMEAYGPIVLDKNGFATWSRSEPTGEVTAHDWIIPPQQDPERPWLHPMGIANVNGEPVLVGGGGGAVVNPRFEEDRPS